MPCCHLSSMHCWPYGPVFTDSIWAGLRGHGFDGAVFGEEDMMRLEDILRSGWVRTVARDSCHWLIGWISERKRKMFGQVTGFWCCYSRGR